LDRKRSAYHVLVQAKCTYRKVARHDVDSNGVRGR
jgi:hypothetical protein